MFALLSDNQERYLIWHVTAVNLISHNPWVNFVWPSVENRCQHIPVPRRAMASQQNHIRMVPQYQGKVQACVFDWAGKGSSCLNWVSMYFLSSLTLQILLLYYHNIKATVFQEPCVMLVFLPRSFHSRRCLRKRESQSLMMKQGGQWESTKGWVA